MTAFRAKSNRTVRHELCSLALMLAVPSAIALVFPYEAVGFRAKAHPAARAPGCAFVTLTAEEERAALAAARTAWQVGAKDVRGLRAELSAFELPPAPVRPVIDVRAVRAPSVATADFVPDPLPPSVRAPRPARLAPEAESASASAPAFPRGELLKID